MKSQFIPGGRGVYFIHVGLNQAVLAVVFSKPRRGPTVVPPPDKASAGPSRKRIRRLDGCCGGGRQVHLKHDYSSTKSPAGLVKRWQDGELTAKDKQEAAGSLCCGANARLHMYDCTVCGLYSPTGYNVAERRFSSSMYVFHLGEDDMRCLSCVERVLKVPYRGHFLCGEAA